MEIQNIVSIKGITQLVNTYRTQLVTGIILITLALGGFIYWQYSRIQYEQNALQALSEILVEYNKAYENSELWQDIEVGARTGYRQYARSTLGPFFLGLQVESLLQQDKLDDAITLMGTMMKKVSPHLPFYYLNAIKLARMKLSSENEEQQAEGLNELKNLAENQKNTQKEQARYYLGLYYHSHDQTDKAKEQWQSLRTLEDQTGKRSVWALMAEQQIKQG